ncbi:outer membrane beta-barrel protein [Halofilum ochraceum]|uniref:outer membrane beta-barrel protein n=1 Tax=Halofilum ochraceum TaxID=1611323 RepID=UPI00082D0381|nr:outer membrane beta-barrel protein [Halofilum ochraceum]
MKRRLLKVMGGIHRASGFSLLAILAVFPALGFAQTNVEIGFRLESTDNIGLTEENEQSDLARTPYMNFDWSTASRALTAGIEGNLEYRDYRDDATTDGTAGDLSAVADLHLIEDRLDFRFENRFQQVRTEELDPQTPDNIEDVNTFTMGPDLRFDPSPVDQLTFGARYGNTYFERGNDSERWALGAMWSHRLSTLNEVAVNIQRQDVEFTEFSGDPLDYTLDEIGIGGTHRLARGSVSLTGGQRRIEQENGNWIERGFARFDWAYKPTRRTEFDLTAETGLTDTGVRLLGRNAQTVELPAADAFDNDDIVILSEVQARLIRRGAKLDVTLGGLVAEEDFKTGNLQLDRERFGGSLGIEYPLTPVDRVEWLIRGERTDYLLLNRRDDDWTTSIRLRHLLGRNMFVEGGYLYWERDSSAAGSSFEENRVFLAAGYRWGE